MNIEYLKDNGINIAVVSGDEMVIVDMQSALDLAMTVKIDSVGEGISSEVLFLCAFLGGVCEGLIWRPFFAMMGSGKRLAV